MTLLEHDDDRRYTLEEIEAAVSALEEKYSGKSSKAPNKRINAPAVANDNNERKPNFEAIVAGCGWMEQWVENAANASERDWYAQAGIVGCCEDGREIFHRISESHAGYSREETDKKLDHALDAAGPRTCANIRDSLGYAACRNCPFVDKITSPIELGYRDPVQVELMAKYILDVDTGTYVENSTGERLSAESFSMKHQHRIKKGTPHRMLVGNALTRKVDRIDYLPGNANRYIEDGKEHVILNKYRPGGVEPQVTAPSFRITSPILSPMKLSGNIF